ncbi:hypothetical protein CEXT_551451 [Caerostris extrusa]|uniref:Ycf15 n=1 Tax=Caerostris extrusa TaxID=172846 RepID=A0AAV4P1Z3_CAEEX|nr:hypothetical protein CEXT_551451 [Caerostris extrusa]
MCHFYIPSINKKKTSKFLQQPDDPYLILTQNRTQPMSLKFWQTIRPNSDIPHFCLNSHNEEKNEEWKNGTSLVLPLRKRGSPPNHSMGSLTDQVLQCA